MNAAPIELVFYDDEDQPVITHKRARIPSYLLDMAISLQVQLSQVQLSTQDPAEQGADALNALFDFIVEFYGNKFTRDELKKQTDLVECMAVVKAVIVRASQLTTEFAKANPRGPSPKKKSTEMGAGSGT